MRKKISIVLAVIAGLIAAFLVVVAMQPSEFHVARSNTIAAVPEQVFAHVNNFHKWDAWSPWIKLDPNARNTYEGPDEGEGAIFRWVGNQDVGEGSMTIVNSQPPERIQIRLDFIKPFEDTANVDFTFQPQGAKTGVTWSMSGENNFIAKAMCLFMDMDKLVGDKFEEGLASLKKEVESAPAETAPAADSSAAPAAASPAQPAADTSTPGK
jgi:hypothetical protein